jgi:hypothetical protein
MEKFTLFTHPFEGDKSWQSILSAKDVNQIYLLDQEFVRIAVTISAIRKVTESL